MADISLTASMRSNLLSLQSTQSLMDMTQERLSTGKKVNSAIDNPSSYYTAQSLNNRANDLSSLLDSMGQGIQTIKAADEAITTITSFAEQAKAIANSARDVPSNFDKYAITSEEVLSPIEGEIIIDARADLSTFNLKVVEGDDTKQFSVYVNGKKNDLTISGGDAAAVEANVINQLQGLGLNAKGDGVGGITVSSTDGTAISWTNGSNGKDGATKGLATSDSAAVVVTLDTTSGANSATIAGAINTAGEDLGITAEADGKALSGSGNTFDFTVSTQATNALTVPYTISLTKVADSTLTDDEVKVYLTKDGSPVVEPTKISALSAFASRGDSKTLYTTQDVYTTTDEPAKTSNYVLRMWIDQDVAVSGDASKTYKAKVNVDSTVTPVA